MTKVEKVVCVLLIFSFCSASGLGCGFVRGARPVRPARLSLFGTRGEKEGRTVVDGASSEAAHLTTSVAVEVTETPTSPRSRLGFLALTPKKGREGTIFLSWGGAAITICMQIGFTNWERLGKDSVVFWNFMIDRLPHHQDILLGLANIDIPGQNQMLCLYAFVWLNMVGFLFAMPIVFPPQQSANHRPMEVPHRGRPRQHQLTNVDCSYILLNTLMMPGFFYHFFCVLRSWGLSLEGLLPPGDDSTSAVFTMDMESLFAAAAMISEALPALALYFFAYELCYYRWHRSLHEVPLLYKWIHKHHHQQTYPDRPALDTLNTACVESCIATYMQLGVMWACGEYFGVKNVPAGIVFFELAGWLSVLEHDKFERALPWGLWQANEHHMHHSYVKCNYAPYSTLWDKVFGTWKPFQTTAQARAVRTADSYVSAAVQLPVLNNTVVPTAGNNP